MDYSHCLQSNSGSSWQNYKTWAKDCLKSYTDNRKLKLSLLLNWSALHIHLFYIFQSNQKLFKSPLKLFQFYKTKDDGYLAVGLAWLLLSSGSGVLFYLVVFGLAFFAPVFFYFFSCIRCWCVLFLHVLRFSWNLHTNCVWRWALYTGCTVAVAAVAVAGRELSPKPSWARCRSFIHWATHSHCHQRVKVSILPRSLPLSTDNNNNNIWLLSILWASINNRNWNWDSDCDWPSPQSKRNIRLYSLYTYKLSNDLCDIHFKKNIGLSFR